MSDGAGAVGAFVAAGLVYWFAMAVAMAAAAAVIGLVAAGLLALGLLAVALRAWFRNLGEARRLKDWGWTRDLLLAPLAGLLAALALSRPFIDWWHGPFTDYWDGTIEGGDQSTEVVWPALILLPLTAITFVICLVLLPSTLKRTGRRWLAYPGFAFYAVCVGAIAINLTLPPLPAMPGSTTCAKWLAWAGSDDGRRQDAARRSVPDYLEARDQCRKYPTAPLVNITAAS